MTEKKLLTFPCSFPIKALGKNTDDFEQVVFDIFRQHVPDLQQCKINSRPSKDNNYLSITITIEAQSQAQLDAIYQDLSAHPKVVMAL